MEKLKHGLWISSNGGRRREDVGACGEEKWEVWEG